MIKYKSDLFGLRTLCVWHGSAAFRAFLPAFLSTLLLLLFKYWVGAEDLDATVENTYVITVFILFFSFLLTIRLNYSYQRYWEAATHIHRMSSKWLDSAICLASFHYQCEQYDDKRPVTFGKNPNSRNETRERERTRSQTLEATETLVNQVESKATSVLQYLFGKKSTTTQDRNLPRTTTPTKAFKPNRKAQDAAENHFAHHTTGLHSMRPKAPPAQAWRAAFASSKGKKGRTLLHLTGLDSSVPSLFLQEAAHLYSLLSAVAMATLRNDVEGAESPLTEYIPGQPFPPVNPDELGADIKKQYHEESPLWTCIYFVLGLSRSAKQRTLYNAARPFRVIGGISDREAELLQQARGPYAQMALCNMWLKEFVSREQLNGSTGDVAAPIVGRVFQFISDGVAAYNQCRKIAFVPFPFPHGQITAFFTALALVVFPLLYVAFVNSITLACILNFTTVLCFKGIHEVARELTNPYITVPNDLPLNNFQSQFNEALVVMYAGFHPDSWSSSEEKEEEQVTENGEASLS